MNVAPVAPAPTWQLDTSIRIGHHEKVADVRTRTGFRHDYVRDAYADLTAPATNAVKVGMYTDFESYNAARKAALKINGPQTSGLVLDATNTWWSVPLTGDLDVLNHWWNRQPHGWFQADRGPATAQLTDVLIGANYLNVGGPFPSVIVKADRVVDDKETVAP